VVTTQAVESEASTATAAALPAESTEPATTPAPVASAEIEQVIPLDPSLPPSIPAPAGEYAIDMASALRLAEIENPQIAEARVAITAALAQQMKAMSLLLPSLNFGGNYHGHVGNLQRSSGRILNLSEQSLYLGSGSRTLAAESLAFPGVNIDSSITDAWFEPLAAFQRVSSARFTARATANSVLMEVGLAHLDLIAASAILDAQRRSEAQAVEIVRVTHEYAAAGEGRTADANRATTELQLRRAEVQKAEEELGVISARLAQILNLDSSVQLRPFVPNVAPISLIDISTETSELVRVALLRRPEVGARSADVSEADVHYHQELARPWLPNLWLGFSGGVLGGGSNIVPPLMGNFGGRNDFDVRLYWTFQNFGFGNVGLQRRRNAMLGEALAERARLINLVRREVVAAQAGAKASLNQIELARRELAAAESGFQEDLARSRQNLGRPIEVLNNLGLLADARVKLVRTITAYNQQQLRLFVSLGSPPPLPGPPQADLSQAPVTTPIFAPFHTEAY
jgi:outer membrane protein TolC